MNQVQQVTPVDAWKFRQLYAAGMAVRTIGSRLGFGSTTVHRRLKRDGMVCRRAGYISRKYHCNDFAFDVIDTEAKAYWLGFLAADGSFGQKGRLVELSLARKDRSQIEAFIKFLDSNYRIHDGFNVVGQKKFPRSQVDIFSMHMVETLKGYGLSSGRVAWMPWPELIGRGLTRHYLRGYFDGDGCFWKDKRRTAKSVKFGLLGNETFLRSCANFIQKKCGVAPKNPRKAGKSLKVKSLEYDAMSDVAKIAHLMYDGATVFLQRKFDVVRPLLDATGF